jgi:hypothetical protein
VISHSPTENDDEENQRGGDVSAATAPDLKNLTCPEEQHHTRETSVLVSHTIEASTAPYADREEGMVANEHPYTRMSAHVHHDCRHSKQMLHEEPTYFQIDVFPEATIENLLQLLHTHAKGAYGTQHAFERSCTATTWCMTYPKTQHRIDSLLGA